LYVQDYPSVPLLEVMENIFPNVLINENLGTFKDIAPDKPIKRTDNSVEACVEDLFIKIRSGELPRLKNK